MTSARTRPTAASNSSVLSQTPAAGVAIWCCTPVMVSSLISRTLRNQTPERLLVHLADRRPGQAVDEGECPRDVVLTELVEDPLAELGDVDGQSRFRYADGVHRLAFHIVGQSDRRRHAYAGLPGQDVLQQVRVDVVR